MKRVILILALISSPSLAQNQSQRGMAYSPVPQPAPYTRADFERDCIKMAPPEIPDWLATNEERAKREAWIARCKKDAP